MECQVERLVVVVVFGRHVMSFHIVSMHRKRRPRMWTTGRIWFRISTENVPFIDSYFIDKFIWEIVEWMTHCYTDLKVKLFDCVDCNDAIIRNFDVRKYLLASERTYKCRNLFWCMSNTKCISISIIIYSLHLIHWPGTLLMHEKLMRCEWHLVQSQMP